MHNESNDQERSAFEQALAGLTPTAPLARDDLFFAAGLRRGRTRCSARAGKLRAAVPGRSQPRRSRLLSAGLSAVLITRSPRTEIVYVERPAAIQQEATAVVLAPPAAAAPVERNAQTPPRTGNPFPPESYASLRDQALRGEFDRRAATETGTPAQAATPATEPPSYRALRDCAARDGGLVQIRP